MIPNWEFLLVVGLGALFGNSILFYLLRDEKDPPPDLRDFPTNQQPTSHIPSEIPSQIHIPLPSHSRQHEKVLR